MSLTLKTSLGDIKIELHCAQCPKLCYSMLALASSGFYDGLIFHRNMKGFIVQGGSPTGKGKAGDSIWGNRLPDHFNAELKHDRRGIVSMANNGPDTNGSQFFMTYDAHPHLNNVYSVVGHVIYGMEVLDAMEKAPVNAKNRPVVPIVIENVEIHANPFAEQQTG